MKSWKKCLLCGRRLTKINEKLYRCKWCKLDFDTDCEYINEENENKD